MSNKEKICAYQQGDYLVMENGVKVIIAPENHFNKIVRVKKHHKRRIDKKWEKRYGYKQVPIKSQCFCVDGGRAIVCSQSFYDNVLKDVLVI